MLTDRGFKDVYALKGGFDAWKEAGYPTERKS
ncbi:MAG: rhodanese-like domain-containing protein [Chloroflexi bacterium]|nr:rhodanese-like domain-containing protein [Chloroflexota bacterium]MBI4329994.1 rhodanese-like domain-containing protein [Chloroflexota bacterium]